MSEQWLPIEVHVHCVIYKGKLKTTYKQCLLYRDDTFYLKVFYDLQCQRLFKSIGICQYQFHYYLGVYRYHQPHQSDESS